MNDVQKHVALAILACAAAVANTMHLAIIVPVEVVELALALLKGGKH